MLDLAHDFFKKYHKVLVSLSWSTREPNLSKAYKKIVYRNFQFFQSFMWTSGFLLDMNMYYIKIFLKENYAIALNIYCLFTKKIMKLELNMMFMALMGFTYIRHS